MTTLYYLSRAIIVIMTLAFSALVALTVQGVVQTPCTMGEIIWAAAMNIVALASIVLATAVTLRIPKPVRC